MNKKTFEYIILMLLIFFTSHLVAEPCGDINSIDGITIVDALLIAQYYVDLITKLPGCDQTTPDPTSPPQLLDCSEAPVWSTDEIYDTAGMRVQYNGNLYENNWYTQNQNPEENSGNNEVWTLIGPCDPGLTPVPATPSPTPTPTPVEQPTQTPTPEPNDTPITPDSNLVGFASLNGGTTGGSAGETVTVTDSGSLKDALRSDGAIIVRIQGIISIGAIAIQNQTNKTIIGANTSSGWNGNIQFKECSNFIIRNLNISSPSNGDGITIQDESHNFWVDHCSFGNCSDGQLDITHGADNITISWCIFSYTSEQSDHRFSNLIGHDDDNGDEDRGKLHVTFHHNCWGTLCHERMPRLRFGHVHLLNNYYNTSGNNYCASSSIEGQILIQNNYFEGVEDLWNSEQGGLVNASGNTLVNCSGSSSPTGDSVFSPPYSYTLDSASETRSNVRSDAGSK